MKKFLSLVLALVMTMSLVTISAGAKDFDDNGDIDYKEAVDVISALGIVDGYSDDSFRPDGSLTRGAAAKIICNLILGPTTASALSATTAPFKDVPTTNVFAGYITYCAQQGIFGGYGDGTFRPSGTLTGNAFMKMLLGALGYDSSIEGYSGSNWSVQVIKQAVGIGLNAGNDDFVGSRTVTRQEAALYAFNMLKSTMVQYDSKTTVVVGDVTVDTIPARGEMGNGATIEGIKNDNKMQFAERYFDDLRMNDDDVDAFNRPATTWRYDGNTIGTYTNAADLTYTTEVEVGTIYKDLGLSKNLTTTAVDVFEDGAAKTSYGIVKGDSENKLGGNGVLTEVFYDEDDETAVISQINTYMGEVTSTHKATATKDAYVAVSPKVDGIVTGGNFETDEAFDAEDLVMFTYSYKAGEGVQSVVPANEGITGELNSFTENKRVTVADEPYSVNAKNKAIVNKSDLTNAADQEVTIYLDDYGYVLWIDTEAISGNYAVVIGKGNSTLDDEVKLLLADGTTARGTVDSFTTSSLDTSFSALNVGDIVTYTVNSSNEYKLTTVAQVQTVSDTSGIKIVENGDSTLNSSSANAYLEANDGTVHANRANGKTLFLIATTVNRNTVYSVYEGIANVPTVTTTASNAGMNVTAYVKDVVDGTPDTGAARVVYIDATGGNADVTGDSKDVIFVMGGSANGTYSSALGGYYEYDAIINGSFDKIKSDDPVDGLAMFGKVSYDTNGIASLDNGYYFDTDTNAFVEVGSASSSNVDSGIGTDKQSNGVLLLGNSYETVADDCKVFRVDADGDLEESVFTAASVAKDDNDRVWYHVDTGTGDVDYIVIETVEGDETPSYSTDLKFVEFTQSSLSAATLTYYIEDGSVKTASVEDIYALLQAAGLKDVRAENGAWSYTSASGMTYTGVSVTATQVFAGTFDSKVVTVGGIDFQILSADKEYAIAGGTITLTIAAKGTGAGSNKTLVVTPARAANAPAGQTAGAASGLTAGATKADGTGTAVITGMTSATAATFTTGTGAVDARYTVTITIDSSKPADTHVTLVPGV